MENETNKQQEPVVDILYFTDLCCSWCWAIEPMLYRLKETYRDQIGFHYVMGGLIQEMSTFYDPTHDISTTQQIAAHVIEVSEHSGQPIDEGFVAHEDDLHYSSWPACIAIVAAKLQDEQIGEHYLRRMRRANYTEGESVSHPEKYMALAQDIEGLDLKRFTSALESGEAERAFKKDLEFTAQLDVSGFPTMLFVPRNGQIAPFLVRGYQSCETYRQVFQQLAPEMGTHEPRTATTVLAAYGVMTTRELAELYQRPLQEMRAELERNSSVNKTPVKRGELWHLAQEQKSTAGYQYLLEGRNRPAMVVWNEPGESGGAMCDVTTGQCELPSETNDAR